MASIKETEAGFVYAHEEIEIPLMEDTYQAFKHRLLPYVQVDWIGVLDPRDGEWFSHFRYDQPTKCFDEMMQLAYMIGSIHITDTPFNHIQEMFERTHQVAEDEFEHLLDET